MKDKLISLYQEKYPGESTPPRVFFSPGRINIMGEHVDYCGGNVLPAAINFGNYGIAGIRADRAIYIYSKNMNEQITLDIDKLTKLPEGHWGNYFIGVFKALAERQIALVPMNLYIWGNLPHSSGLSSSASIELLAAVIQLSFSGKELDRVELVQLCQSVENEFIGVKCGIMDQFIVGLGKENSMVLLNCDSLKYRHIVFENPKYQFIVINTNKPRKLGGSEYNDRREVCTKSLRKLQTMYPKAKNLSELTLTDLDQGKSILSAVELKRTSHVISECLRVKEVVRSLASNDYYTLGKALYSSHLSLKNDFNVSCIELDTIVDLGKGVPGVIGARMTGGGFGGCAIALIDQSIKEKYITEVSNAYEKEFGYKASFFSVDFVDGSKELI